MDLKTRDSRSAARWRAPLVLSVLGLVASVAFWATAPKKEVESRPLGIEEREAVIELFTALEGNAPELARFTEEAREVFTDESLPAYTQAGATALVAYHDDSLVFSERFFQADPIAQQTALLEAVLAMKHQPARAEGAIAVRPE